MKIAANSLEAFLAVARTAHFSRAANQLAISQSALSQRILNLESQLETTLFVRDRAGSRLTPEGEELLRYAQAQESLEEEFLASRAKGTGKGALSGSLRVGGFSSLTRSVLLPALAPIAREHPVRLSLFSRELLELPDLLRQGEADLVVVDSELSREGLEAVLLGYEENVLVRSRKWKRADFYLDHDANDLITQRYLQKFHNARGRKAERRFLDEVYNLIEGVRLVLGQAVVSRHLVEGDKELEIVEPEKVLKTPVWLHYPAQAYYPRVQVAARDAIVAYANEKLASR